MSEPMPIPPSSMTPPQQPMPTPPDVPPNKMVDTILIIGALTGTCEMIGDKPNKVACRQLLDPLENGKADPVEALADMMIANPGEFDGIVDRFNDLIQKASDRAEEMIKTTNAT